MVKTSHYGASMKPTLLQKQVDQICKKMKLKLKDDDTVVLFYSGMSGVASATAMALSMDKFNIKFGGMVYVRKNNEDSHGRPVETSLMSVKKTDHMIPVFVDDFVSEGNTFNYVINSVRAFVKYRNLWFIKTGNRILKNFDMLLNEKENWWVAQLQTNKFSKAKDVHMEEEDA